MKNKTDSLTNQPTGLNMSPWCVGVTVSVNTWVRSLPSHIVTCVAHHRRACSRVASGRREQSVATLGSRRAQRSLTNRTAPSALMVMGARAGPGAAKMRGDQSADCRAKKKGGKRLDRRQINRLVRNQTDS